MNERSTTIIIIIGIVSFLLLGTLLAGPVLAEHKNTGALNGPIYEWLNQEEIRERYVSQGEDDNGLERDPQIYFSGGFDDIDSIIVRSSYELIEADNDIDGPEDLPEDMQEELGGKDSIENEEGAVYEYSKDILSDDAAVGKVGDWTFEEPPAGEIKTWNYLNSFHGWGADMNKGGANDIALPEREHFEQMAPSEEGKTRKEYKNNPPERDDGKVLEMDHSGNTLTASKDMQVVIYSNDPSIWTHLHRYKNTDSSEYNKDKLFDRSYKQIGDSGVLRVVYDQGYQPDDGIPSDYFDVPVDVSTGDTRWEYDNEDISVRDFTVKIHNETGSDCSTTCDITEQSEVTRSRNGVASIEWDLSDEERFEGLAGDRVTFEVEMTVGASYDKRTETAEVTCEDEATEEEAALSKILKEGDCIDWDTDWYFEDLKSDVVTGEVTVSDKKEYVFTDGTGLFQSDDDVSVRKAEFPDGSYQYEIQTDGDIYTGEPSGWNSVRLDNSGNETAYSQWSYFSSRDKSWDDLYDQNGDEYSSEARPLRLHAFPEYNYYNYDDSSMRVLTPEEAGIEPSTEYPTPALVGHETCVQNYGENGVGFSDSVKGSPTGSYEYYEPCYWTIDGSGQSTAREIPGQYLRLPHRVSNPGILSKIPGVKDEEMSYNEYVFDKELSGMINDDIDKLYTGDYSYMDTVVVESNKNVNRVYVDGLVPNMTAEEEVDETVEVAPSNMDVEVQPICEGDETGDECEQNPIASDDYDTYTIEITLEKVLPSGETEPINTEERGESIKVNNALNYSETGSEGSYTVGTKWVDTNEEGKARVEITEPEDSSEPTIDVEYEPTHWTETDDPIAAQSLVDNSSSVSQVHWLRQFAGILFVMWFILLAINKPLNKVNRSFNPLKTFSSLFMESWVKTGIWLALIALIVLKTDNIYPIVLFLFALFLLQSLSRKV